MRKRLALSPLVLALALAACSSKPVITVDDVTNAERNGTLPSLYNHLKAETVGKDRARKKDQPLFAQLDAIGRKLAGAQEADLRRQLEAARLPDGIVPVDVLAEVQAAAEPMRTWEPARFDTFNRDLARETGVTQKHVREAREAMDALPADALRRRMELLARMEKLSGDSRYGEQREAMERQLRADFEQAKATDDFETALRLLDELPPDRNSGAVRVELQTRLLERQFNEALAEDRPDEAYRLFSGLSTSPHFPALKPRIEPTALDMANYFVALGSSALAANNMADAWRWFSQARIVRQRLGAETHALPEEKPFVDRAYRGHDNARKEGLWGVALGYLAVIADLDPSRPTLARDTRTVEEEVGRQAIRSAAILPFASAAGSADYSGSMVTRLTEYLFNNVASDVRIVTADGKSAVDLQVTGSIDEARVATSENPVRKTQRVVTARGVMQPNPKYAEWSRLTERQRKSVPQPPAQVPVDVTEDISYNVVQVRKVGYFSVAFRVVETATGNVVHTDSVTLKREYADESNEGVEIGQFQLPARAARVPTDIEILNQLVTEASDEIGKRLAARVSAIEQRYADAGKSAAAAGNSTEAAQAWAKAVVVGAAKGQDVGPWREELKRNAVATGYTR